MHLIVVFAPPQKEGGGLDFGRIDRAIALAKARKDSLILMVGDGNHGRDCKAFVAYATVHGVKATAVSNLGNASTRGDAEAVAIEIASLVYTLPRVRVELSLVTCWYHVPRAWTMLFGELRKHNVTIPPVPRPHWGNWHEVRRVPGELRGVYDYARGKPNIPRGRYAATGKPVANKSSIHSK
jgi:hypothetical protein